MPAKVYLNEVFLTREDICIIGIMATIFCKLSPHQLATCIGLSLAILIIISSWSKTSNKVDHQYCTQPVKSQSYYKSYLDAESDLRARFAQKLAPFLQEATSPWRNNWGIYFWDAFIPTMTCPHFLYRVGAPAGGGKWVCGFELFTIPTDNKNVDNAAPCVSYSFGVGPDSSFEAEFLSRTNCSVYMFDHTIGAPVNGPGARLPPGLEHRWTFENMGLGNEETASVQTLGYTMRKYGHEWIDFLKVDIEWAEFHTFSQIMEEFDILPFGQLNLEIHLQNTRLNDTADMKEFKDFSKWWNGLINHGLRAFTWEVNHHPTVIARGAKPFAVEYSFLNIKRNPKLLLIQ